MVFYFSFAVIYPNISYCTEPRTFCFYVCILVMTCDDNVLIAANAGLTRTRDLWLTGIFSLFADKVKSKLHLSALTCQQTLAGVTGGQGLDAVGRVRDLVSPILDGDGVVPGGVRYVGHGVGTVSVVLDAGLLRLAFWVLRTCDSSQRNCHLPLGNTNVI